MDAKALTVEQILCGRTSSVNKCRPIINWGQVEMLCMTGIAGSPAHRGATLMYQNQGRFKMSLRSGFKSGEIHHSAVFIVVIAGKVAPQDAGTI